MSLKGFHFVTFWDIFLDEALTKFLVFGREKGNKLGSYLLCVEFADRKQKDYLPIVLPFSKSGRNFSSNLKSQQCLPTLRRSSSFLELPPASYTNCGSSGSSSWQQWTTGKKPMSAGKRPKLSLVAFILNGRLFLERLNSSMALGPRSLIHV